MIVPTYYSHDLKKWLSIRVHFSLKDGKPKSKNPEVSIERGEWSMLNHLNEPNEYKLCLELWHGRSSGFKKYTTGAKVGSGWRSEIEWHGYDYEPSRERFAPSPYGSLAEAVCVWQATRNSGDRTRSFIKSWFNEHHASSYAAFNAVLKKDWLEEFGDSDERRTAPPDSYFEGKIISASIHNVITKHIPFDRAYKKKNRIPCVVIDTIEPDPVDLSRFLI